MIADLHCHYPMHLVPHEHPHVHGEGLFDRIRNRLEDEAVDIARRLFNDESWRSDWRLDFDDLYAAGARTLCSVLFWPPAEFDFDEPYGAAPEDGYYDALQQQLDDVEKELERHDRHVIVKRASDLDGDDRIAFVHCVEGGFHLGPDEVEEHVAWLADKGVVYITLAHLFFRGVAANAPAIPRLSDRQYDHCFPQEPGVGLTELGRAAVRAMHKHKVLIDITHMRQDAIDATFELVEQLDGDDHDPRDFPIIATHVGMRDVEPGQSYNLTAGTLRRIQARGGVAGLILAQHQLGETDDEEESRALLGRHIDAMAEAAGGSYEVTALGTDLDGFIKPTIAGVQRGSDLRKLEDWIRADYEHDADAILRENARRVLRRAFEARGAN